MNKKDVKNTVRLAVVKIGLLVARAWDRSRISNTIKRVTLYALLIELFRSLSGDNWVLSFVEGSLILTVCATIIITL